MGGSRAAAAGDEHRRQFAKGSVVEVAGEGGTRFVATVISTPWISWSSWSPTSQKKNSPNSNSSNKFLVEYRSLFDDDGSTPLRKHVEIHRVRPLPPPPNPATSSSFQLHDVVDAFFRDSWWTGEITRVLDKSSFAVKLHNSQEEIQCGLAELRVHRDWIGGKWVPPPPPPPPPNKVLPANKKTDQLKGGVNRPKKRGRLSILLGQTTNASVPGVSPSRIMGQCTETRERQNEIPMRAGAGNGNAELGSDANQGFLPFVKTSPLLKRIESKEREVSSNRIIGQCTETRGRQKEIPLHACAADGNAEIGSDSTECLPFVKTSPLWKTIESMEVFQVMRQKPHFRPLNSCNEGLREGLAIGCMVTFSGMVKKTSELQFDDPRSTIEDILETLLDLEAHGFDVKLLRDRLTRLLLIKDRQQHLQGESKELEIQIMEHSHEKTKSNEEIGEINEQIRELQEKRALALSTKKIKDSEIATLQSEMSTINQDVKNIQLDFEELATAPW